MAHIAHAGDNESPRERASRQHGRFLERAVRSNDSAGRLADHRAAFAGVHARTEGSGVDSIIDRLVANSVERGVPVVADFTHILDSDPPPEMREAIKELLLEMPADRYPLEKTSGRRKSMSGSRQDTLLDLVEVRRPLADCIAAVQELSQDSDVELVELNRSHLNRMLRGLLEQEFSPEELTAWADAIECRDLACEPGHEELIRRIVQEMANPDLVGRPTTDSATTWLHDLELSRRVPLNALPDGYRMQMASDIERDGMGLELLDPTGRIVAEVFYFDETGQEVFNTGAALSIDLALLQFFLDRARAEIRPVILHW